jgi:hypothetical protein
MLPLFVFRAIIACHSLISPHSLQMRFLFTLIIATAVAAGLFNVLSSTTPGFGIASDGARAIFTFTESNWDTVFGSISIRDMNDKLVAVLGKVNTLEQDLKSALAELNTTLAMLNASEVQQAIRCSLLSFSSVPGRKPAAKRQDCELGG